MTARGDALAQYFEALLALEERARPAALAALAVDAATRAELEALLAADARTNTRLARAVEGGAARLALPAGGTLLGPWRIVREIGAGGMGTVFLGERADGAYAQQVAIKLLRGFPTADGIARLRRERQILAQLDHLYIARLLDGGETPEGQPYLVMEYVDGVPLSQWLATAPRDRSERLVLFDRLAEAVAHAHRHLVIHRDLKPGNVLVRADGTPKLLDFGVARLAAADDADGSTRVLSAGWASPEQIAGKAVTTASDVYSLGVILRVLLGGRDDRAPDAPAPLADAELRGVIAMATATEPARRYPSVDALREDLAHWRRKRPLRALPDTARYRLGRFLARHRLATLVMAMAVVAIGVFTWRLAVERDRALAAERLAAENLRRAVLTQRFLSSTLIGAGARDADGKPVDGRALIERAAAGLESELGDDPGALAEAATVVAQAYMNALDFERAAGAARLAVERAPPQERPIVRAERLRLLARNLVSLGRNDEAAAFARAGLALLPDPPPDREVAETATRLRVTLARALGSGGPQARTVREALWHYARAHLPHGNALRGMAASLWAGVLEVEDRLDELPAARQLALDEWRADPGAFATDLAYQETNLARALRLAGRLDEAEARAEAAAARFAEALGGRRMSGRAMATAERAMIALARGDPAAARAWIARYRTESEGLGLEENFESLYLDAAWSLDTDVEAARAALAQAAVRAHTPAERRSVAALSARLPASP